MIEGIYENILLKSTTNDELKELESKTGIFIMSKDKALAKFITNENQIIIPMILYVGDFFNPFCNSILIKDDKGYEYIFDRTDLIYEEKSLSESVE